MNPASRVIATLLGGLAMVFLLAPSASASVIGTEAYGASLSSEQLEETVIGTEAGSVKCKKTTLSGTLAEPGPASLTPTFTECTFGGMAGTLSATGCKLVLRPGEETSAQHFQGTMDVSCTEGNAIVASFGTCEVKVENQSNLNSVPLTDESGSPEKFSAKFEVSSLAYNVTKDGFLCAFSSTGKRTNGTVAGKQRISASSGATPVGVFALKEPVFACETSEECTQVKGMKFPFTVKASAPSSKIEAGGITITCQETKLEYSVGGNLGSGNLIAQGKELKFNVKNCKTANVANCATVESEAPFVVSMSLTGFIGTLIDLRVICGAEVNCKYFRAKEPWAFTGGGPATIVATANLLEREVIAGEKGCVQEPKVTASFTVSAPNPFKLGK